MSRGEILVLLHDRFEWEKLEYPRTVGLADTLTAEADRRGVFLRAAFTCDHAPSSGNPPVGREEVLAHARALGDRYLGTIAPLNRASTPDLDSWLEAMSGPGRPVVWVDIYDDGGLDGRALPGLTRCHFQESAALNAALRHLTGLGHRRVLYVGHKDVAWHRERALALEALVRAQEPAVELAVVLNTDTDNVDAVRRFPDSVRWFERNGSDVAKRKVALFRRDIPQFEELAWSLAPSSDVWKVLSTLSRGASMVGEYYDHLKAMMLSPYYRRCFDPFDFTAVIAPNEGEADFLSFWLDCMGVRVPEQVSVITFDNYPQFLCLPVTTVDFGFDHLGRAALHTILGDIPVRRDAHGNVPSRPFIVHRGSVGRPRRKRTVALPS